MQTRAHHCWMAAERKVNGRARPAHALEGDAPRFAALACGHCRHTPLPAARYLFHQRRFGAGLFLFDQRQPGVYFTPTVERLRWACPGSL